MSLKQHLMKKLTIAALACCFLAACNNGANNQHPSSKYEEKKASIGEMEQESPLKFLKVTGEFRNNLINQTVIEGEVANTATLTTYKNIEVQVNFKDKEGASIEKQKHTLDDVVKPGTTTDFKIKVSHVSEAESITIDIVDATPDK